MNDSISAILTTRNERLRRQRVARQIEQRRAIDSQVPSAHEAECCLSKRDEHGRLPIGYCGDDCIRRRRPVTGSGAADR